MADIGTVGAFSALGLYVTWRDVIPWLTRRNGNGRTPAVAACQAGDVMSIMRRQTEILEELKEAHKKTNDTMIELKTIARIKWGGGGC